MSIEELQDERECLAIDLDEMEFRYGARPWDAPACLEELRAIYAKRMREIEHELEQKEADRAAVEELLNSL
jgi:hypothetical protein